MINKKRPRIVDMCKYVDENAYKPDTNMNLIYSYIATIYKSLAFNQRMFQDVQEYEPFGHYAATRVILRLRNERQFLSETDPKKLDKINSILNFIKATIVPYKLMYQKQEKLIANETENNGYSFVGNDTCGINEYDSCYNGLLSIDVQTYLTQVKAIIWDVIKTTPYYSDLTMRYNLYISCLLSLVRAFTINNKDLYRLSNRINNSSYSLTDKSFETLFMKEWESSAVVWGLPNEFMGYVKILTIRIKDTIVQSLKDLIGYYAFNEDLVNDVLMRFIKDTCGLDFNKELE